MMVKRAFHSARNRNIFNRIVRNKRMIFGHLHQGLDKVQCSLIIPFVRLHIERFLQKIHHAIATFKNLELFSKDGRPNTKQCFSRICSVSKKHIIPYIDRFILVEIYNINRRER